MYFRAKLRNALAVCLALMSDTNQDVCMCASFIQRAQLALCFLCSVSVARSLFASPSLALAFDIVFSSM